MPLFEEKTRNIGGQEVEVTCAGNFRHTIHKLFMAGGKIYNFPQNCPGVGINEHIVHTALEERKWIIIRLAEQNNKQYIIWPGEVIELCEKYHSIRQEKGMNLYIVPIKALKPLASE